MSDPRRLGLTVAVPAYRQQCHISFAYMMASLVTFTNVNRLPLYLHFCDSGHLDWARNMLLWTAIKSGADWCLFCDADTSCTDAPGIYRMLQTGNAQRAAVIAAPMKMRNRPGYNVVQGVGTPDQRLAAEDELTGKVVEVDRIGTGFMAISLGWLMKNWAPGKDPEPWFHVDKVPCKGLGEGQHPERVGEDYHFCDHVHRRGGLVLADGRLDVQHCHESSDMVTQGCISDIYTVPPLVSVPDPDTEAAA